MCRLLLVDPTMKKTLLSLKENYDKCGVLQNGTVFIAMRSSVLQCVALTDDFHECFVLECVGVCRRVFCNALQCVAVCCTHG